MKEVSYIKTLITIILASIVSTTVCLAVDNEEDIPVVPPPEPAGIIAMRTDTGWDLIPSSISEEITISIKENGSYKKIELKDGIGRIVTEKHITIKSEIIGGVKAKEFTTFDTELSLPGSDGFIYKKGQQSKVTITTKEPNITQGADILGNMYALSALTTEGKHTISLYQNIDIGLALANSDGMGCGQVAKVVCYDGDNPTVSWEKPEEYKDVVEGIITYVSINAFDSDTGILRVEAKEGAGGVVQVKSPYKLEIKRNGQWLVTVFDKAGNKASCTVDVNWYKVTAPVEPDTKPDDKPDNPDKPNTGTDKPDKEDKYYDSSSVVSGNSNKPTVSSTWDNYWSVKTSSSVISSEPKKNDKTTTSKPPVTPSGYKYIYRGEDEKASAEQVQMELDAILRDLYYDREDIPEEVVSSLAITSDVKLVQEKESVDFKKVAVYTVSGAVCLGIISLAFVLVKKYIL